MAQIAAQKCEFSCDEVAVLYCKGCDQFLCIECRQNVHDKVRKFKDHEVVNIHKEGNRVRPNPVCETHENQFLYYCSKCECLTCAECMTSSHNEHKTEKIKIVADSRRQNVDQIIQQLKTKVEKVKQKLETIDTEYSAQIKSDSESYVEMVEKTVDDLLKIVDRHKLIPLTTASDFKNIENEDLGRKRAFFKNRQDDIVDRLLKFENLMQETHDSTFLTEWKAHQTDVQMNDEETDDPLVAPRRIESFNQKKLTKSVIEVIDEKFQIGLKEQEKAFTKMTEEFGELRTEVESKQRTINEVMKEAAENTRNITTEFEGRIKLLESKLTTSAENSCKAERVQENTKKQLSEAIDQCNRFVQNLSVLSCKQFLEKFHAYLTYYL
ncbi:Hypothetical predicted protein [Mytilus galloprovincialis]|uniref:B box-type domain-containing protein n=1 Tax=Mytilus galloprovincialis TaxID=29158 RepID=A0A8B6D7P8_MYTGA|nr:Hypothetical predicted protein [Mytilus galloprovincialis]